MKKKRKSIWCCYVQGIPRYFSQSLFLLKKIQIFLLQKTFIVALKLIEDTEGVILDFEEKPCFNSIPTIIWVLTKSNF